MVKRGEGWREEGRGEKRGEVGRGGKGWGVESKDTHIIGRVVHAPTHTSLCPTREQTVKGTYLVLGMVLYSMNR